MNNERIDLTLFEEHTKGPWHYEMPPEEGMVIRAGISYVAELSFLMSNMSPETDDVNPTGLDPDAVDARLILASPDLLAELKRCYEREDEAKAIREYIKMYIGEMSAEELLEDILTGAYIDEPEVWKASE